MKNCALLWGGKNKQTKIKKKIIQRYELRGNTVGELTEKRAGANRVSSILLLF